MDDNVVVSVMMSKKNLAKVFGVVVFANVVTFTGLALAAKAVERKPKEEV